MLLFMKKLLATCCLVGTILTPLVANSADDEKVISHRQANFATIGNIVGNINGILKGEVENKESLEALTKALVLATDPAIIVPSFKQDTTGSEIPNRGADKIWTEFARFEENAIAMNQGAIKISELASKGELANMKQMGENLFNTCGVCHRAENFRGPEIK